MYNENLKKILTSPKRDVNTIRRRCVEQTTSLRRMPKSAGLSRMQVWWILDKAGLHPLLPKLHKLTNNWFFERAEFCRGHFGHQHLHTKNFALTRLRSIEMESVIHLVSVSPWFPHISLNTFWQPFCGKHLVRCYWKTVHWAICAGRSLDIRALAPCPRKWAVSAVRCYSTLHLGAVSGERQRILILIGK